MCHYNTRACSHNVLCTSTFTHVQLCTRLIQIVNVGSRYEDLHVDMYTHGIVGGKGLLNITPLKLPDIMYMYVYIHVYIYTHSSLVSCLYSVTYTH